MISVDDVIDYINEATEAKAILYHDNKNQSYIEIEYFSNLGEDVIETIRLEENTCEALLKALNNSLEDYEDHCDETAELYIKERPKGTEGFSCRQLIADADWKVGFWKNFIAELNKHFDICK